jgi:hypothetical protein
MFPSQLMLMAAYVRAELLAKLTPAQHSRCFFAIGRRVTLWGRWPLIGVREIIPKSGWVVLRVLVTVNAKLWRESN